MHACAITNLKLQMSPLLVHSFSKLFRYNMFTPKLLSTQSQLLTLQTKTPQSEPLVCWGISWIKNTDMTVWDGSNIVHNHVHKIWSVNLHMVPALASISFHCNWSIQIPNDHQKHYPKNHCKWSVYKEGLIHCILFGHIYTYHRLVWVSS